MNKLFAVGLTLIACSASPAWAEKRVALVIGNSAYRNIPPLDNPVNDAKLMAETLRGLGFTLTGGRAQLDLDKAAFDAAVQNFGNQLQGADVGLFYYAGHGVQVRGANYLVPVAANPSREADVDFQMLDTNFVLRQMENARTKFNLVILDACRNNPFGGRGLRTAESGLAQMRAPEGTLISFATQPDSIAQDGSDGNSPYTRALASMIRRPGLGIFDTFNEVGLAVKRATGGSQQPWLSSSPIDGNFYFAGLPTVSSSPVATVPKPGSLTKRPQTQPTTLANLYPDKFCHPDQITGHVVKRHFNGLGTILTSVVLESPDGDREIVNIDLERKFGGSKLDTAIIYELNTVFREGNRVSLVVQRCGAAGLVMFLDSARLAPPDH